MFLHHKVQSDILYEMQKNGLAPESTSLYADGKIHRYFVTGDKPGSLNGWYIIYFNEIIIVIFGSWRTGTKHVWTSENRIASWMKLKFCFINKLQKPRRI